MHQRSMVKYLIFMLKISVVVNIELVTRLAIVAITSLEALLYGYNYDLHSGLFI